MQSRLLHIALSAGLCWCLLSFSGCTSQGIYHTVQPGQTLYRIALTYQVDEIELARINNIRDPRQLKAGQRLYIPGAAQSKPVPASVPATASQKPATSAKPTTTVSPATPSKPAPAGPAAPTARTTPAPAVQVPAPAAQPTRGLFAWPLKGKVLTGFGARQDSSHKGIEIEAPKGSTVLAAASGKVIYSGNAIRGYGNLIILEHSDNYFTVYGYNQKNLVSMDDFVGKGDKIALSGIPPNGQTPRLHFEIRRGKTAVDPIFYLP